MLITRAGGEEELQASPDGLGTVVPTFTPSQFERVISTRASVSSVERRQRAMQVLVLVLSWTEINCTKGMKIIYSQRTTACCLQDVTSNPASAVHRK